MLNISFYLLTPKAKSQTQVYVSISNKISRLRFATGEIFIAAYCNIRKTKGKKELIKRNTEFYNDYTSALNGIRDTLLLLERGLSKNGSKPSLEQIRDAYYISSGKEQDNSILTLEAAYSKYKAANLLTWSLNTLNKINGTYNHLTEFEKTNGAIIPSQIDTNFWDGFRDQYCIRQKKFSNNTTNKYLKNIKHFLKFLRKAKILVNDLNLDDLEYLKEIETYNIALKQPEVETLVKLDLSDSLRLDKTRDLFILEILTGQRYSDIPSLLNKNNLHDTYIDIYQQKTNERVKIPLHPELKKHLKFLFAKYPKGLPEISNQKFNISLKEVCKNAEFNKVHSWITMSGNRKVEHTDFRYNLCTSHVGRRTFCTLALRQGINHEDIMKVTGHKSYEQFKAYIKIDDEDSNIAFSSFTTKNKKTKK